MQASASDNPLLASVSVGRIISGKYRIGGLLGAGVCSVVVQAENLQNGQQLAMKLLDREVVQKSGGATRLVDEIRVVSQMTSAHAVKVFAVGALENGEPYLIMELLRGKSLDRLLRDDGPLPVQTAADYVLEASYALLEAHGRGLVHGALKPSNLFLTEDARGNPLIKVSDLGLGVPVHDPLSSGEQYASAFVHASPEQLIGQHPDMRTDIWALGVILFELVSGRPPFTARKLHDVLERGHTVAPPLLRSVHGDVPPGFDAIIRRCLALHPDHRYAKIAELMSELSRFASEDAQRRYALEQEPETEIAAPVDSATRLHFKRGDDHENEGPPSSEATQVRPGLRGAENDEPASSAPTMMRHRETYEPPVPRPPQPPMARPAAGADHAQTLASSSGVSMKRPGTAHMPPLVPSTAAMSNALAETAKLPPQVGAMMNALLPATATSQMGQRPPMAPMRGGAPPASSGIEWEDAPTTMGAAGGGGMVGSMSSNRLLPAAGMSPMMMGPNGAMQQSGALGGPQQPMMVAEVMPESSKRGAVIAVLALALLLILPLIYLNSLAKKTTVAPTLQNASATAAMPAYSFQQGMQQPNRQPQIQPQQIQPQQMQPQQMQPQQMQPQQMQPQQR